MKISFRGAFWMSLGLFHSWCGGPRRLPHEGGDIRAVLGALGVPSHMQPPCHPPALLHVPRGCRLHFMLFHSHFPSPCNPPHSEHRQSLYFCRWYLPDIASQVLPTFPCVLNYCRDFWLEFSACACSRSV